MLFVSRIEKHTVDIDGPNTTDMAIVGAETFTIVRVPNIDNLVFGNRKEQIALTIVFDLGERTCMSLE